MHLQELKKKVFDTQKMIEKLDGIIGEMSTLNNKLEVIYNRGFEEGLDPSQNTKLHHNQQRQVTHFLLLLKTFVFCLCPQGHSAKLVCLCLCL